MKKAFALLLALVILSVCPVSFAKTKATATPPPVEIDTEPVEPPEIIRNMLDIAYAEWESVNGKRLPGSNKYTKWFNNYDWGNNAWCAGYVTWCMLEAGIPQEDMKTVKAGPEEAPEPVFHVKASSPGKMLPGYLHMHRTTTIPQKGFIILYGDGRSNGYVHVGIVYDVQDLGDGKYRLTTLEGAMRNTLRCFVFDYDRNAENIKKNISQVPKEERIAEDSTTFTYEFHKNVINDKTYKWYVHMFFMPWVPGETD